MGGAVISGFPYVLPKNRVDDLVAYCSNRKNSRRTKALNDNVCPWVRFMGCKIRYKDEFCAGFGHYIESYNPKVKSNTTQERAEPFIVICSSESIVIS